MNKKALWAEALIFLAFIGAFFILNLVLPDRQFSEQENPLSPDAARVQLQEPLQRRLYVQI